MTCAIELLEIFLSIKLAKDSGDHIINAPTPIYIWLPWITVIVSFILYYFYLRFKSNHTTKYGII